MADAPVELPGRLAILPFRNKVLLPGAIVRIRCTNPSSVKLVEQELWQREDKGLIGVLPMRDSEAAAVGSILSSGVGGDSGEGGSKSPGGSAGESTKQDAKNGKEPIHWHNCGVAARALHLSRGVEKPSGRVTYIVVLEGLCRFSVQELNARGSYHVARVSRLDMTKTELEQAEQDPDLIALSRQFKATAMELISVLEQKQKTVGRTKLLLETVPVYRLADIFVASFEISFEEQLSMLDSVDLKVRLSKATELVDRHLQSILVAEKITQKVEGQLSKSQKEFLLRQQMRAIKDELGDNDDDEDDVAVLERKMQNAGMPTNIWKHAQRELRRLRKMQPQQPGYSSSRAYLELLGDLPWQKVSEERELDLRAAKESLDRDHYGLTKVKQRIIEYLAVRKLKPDARGPVLCFVGPPGVGKTSLASSIAKALNRKFIRISLGGVKDEADIRGHRRTYIGSMPGRLIDGLKRVSVSNPVMLLDEIDKTGSDVRGDPASALLEVLDPEQNKTFNDHYLNVPFDLSKVVFVATANRMQPIPPALLDRMEVIELPGYTPEEKLKIAMKHLLPRVLEQHGLSSAYLQIPEAVVKLIIERYTREAGVRNLERNLAALARAAAVKVAELDSTLRLGKEIQPITTTLLDSRLADGGEVEMEVIPMGQDISNSYENQSPMVVDEAMLEKVLGPPRFDDREAADRVASPGVSVGLVWTSFGGEVQFVEATAMAGKGDLHLTGQLGDVIKESAQLALTWVRARAADLNLSPNSDINLLESRDIHIHFPAGAVPKDGPSAGVTLVTSLVSLFSNRKVRADTAMTGEMTLRGLVLPVGGVKDKVLAAHRYGIKRVILPERNLKDLAEIPAPILSGMEYPEKVFDVPGMADDFYLNLMDWGKENMLAMALGSDVYLKKEHGKSVQKLPRCDIGSSRPTSVAWSCNGKRLAVGCANSQIEVWDIHVMHRIRTFEGHTARVGNLSWNGNILTSGSRDKYIINYDVRAGTGVYHLKGHGSEVCGLRWSPDGTRLASGANDDVVYVWHSLNMGPTRFLHRLAEHTAAVRALAWCPSTSSRLASGGGTADRCIKIWNTENGACVKTIKTASQVCGLEWNRHENEIVSAHGYSNNELSVWSYPSMEKVADMNRHTKRVLELRQGPDGTKVASASADETLCLWKVSSSKKVVDDDDSVLSLNRLQIR